MRAAAMTMVLMLLAGCASVPAPTTPPAASPAPWGDSVPTPAPAAVAAQPVVGRGSGTITLQPISPTGAAIGTSYAYEMPHCGIGSPIDVDGTFWDAVGVASDSVEFDGMPGLFRLDTPITATFIATGGATLHLIRHVGAKEFRICS